ncbi:hypothetical protein IAU60_004529 [Kwoniella sp. DSM 27419]
MSAQSPTPSMAPPNLKRPRPSAAANSSAAQGTSASVAAAAAPRTKRRKPEGSVGPEGDKRFAGDRAGSGGVAGGSGLARGDEWMDGEVRTKVDFNELPLETLYKYLEYHDLLPRWDVSPWSEDPCTPPNQLYTLPPAAPMVPQAIPHPSLLLHNQSTASSPLASGSLAGAGLESTTGAAPDNADVVMSDSQAVSSGTGQAEVGSADHHAAVPESVSGVHESTMTPVGASVGGAQNGASSSLAATYDIKPVIEADAGQGANEQSEGVPSRPGPGEPGHTPTITGEEGKVASGLDAEDVNGGAVADGNDPEEESLVEPPTTRSKTLPTRRQATTTPTPEPGPEPAIQIKRGVITLSDVHAAREVLAEKANAHWTKGLGGGQNKEGETIVNFLYKMKVGHGRLLRVYNPAPSTYPLW